MTAKLAKRAVLRKLYSHLCLIPTKQSVIPAPSKMTPAMPTAGVILGSSGSASGCVVEDGEEPAESDVAVDIVGPAVADVIKLDTSELSPVLEGCELDPVKVPSTDCAVEVLETSVDVAELKASFELEVSAVVAVIVGPICVVS